MPGLTVRADGTSELTLPVPARPVKRKTRQVQVKRGTILRDVFPVKWPRDGTAKHKANAEYQYLRSAAGFCRSCPNRLNRWKHRCDSCQEKERIRLRSSGKAARSGGRLGFGFKKRRTSKFAKRAATWLRLKGIRIGRRRKPKR